MPTGQTAPLSRDHDPGCRGHPSSRHWSKVHTNTTRLAWTVEGSGDDVLSTSPAAGAAAVYVLTSSSAVSQEDFCGGAGALCFSI